MTPALLGLASAITATSYEDIPAKVREDVSRSLADVLVACAAVPPSQRTGDWWETSVDDPLEATFANAFRAHLLDFDPVHPRTCGHPAGVLLPALLPYFGECSGEQLVLAYSVGHEAMCVLGELYGRSLRRDGTHPTCVLGAVAVAFAVGKLLGHTEDRLWQAALLAVSTSTGHGVNFGSAAKAYQVAVAARNGHAAALASIPAGADARQAFWDVLCRHLEDKDVAPFGTPWRLEHVPTLYKPLPICGYLIPTVVGFTQQLATRLPEDIEAIEVAAPESVTIVCRPGVPQTLEQARFSLGYLLAACLTGTDPMDTNALHDPAIHRLTLSTTITAAETDGIVQIDVRLRSGETHQYTISPETPDGDTVVASKWERYIAGKLPATLAEELTAAVWSLERTTGQDFHRLIRLAVRGDRCA